MPVKSENPARIAARARFAHFAEDTADESDVVDPDNPPMTDAELHELRPAEEVHPALVAAKRIIGFPRSPVSKVAVSLRLDRDIVEKLRSSGPGWQTRANEMLRKALAG